MELEIGTEKRESHEAVHQLGEKIQGKTKELESVEKLTQEIKTDDKERGEENLEMKQHEIIKPTIPMPSPLTKPEQKHPEELTGFESVRKAQTNVDERPGVNAIKLFPLAMKRRQNMRSCLHLKVYARASQRQG